MIEKILFLGFLMSMPFDGFWSIPKSTIVPSIVDALDLDIPTIPIVFGDPDEKRNTCQIVEARGYKCQVHTVTTSQGYQVQLHRIINTVDNDILRYPVLIQTGLIGTSADFVMASSQVYVNDTNLIGQNLGFELAKQGYDVWLSNNRGNEYGQGHVSLSPDDSKFWNFTFDEMSQFDLPSFIDYVVANTSAARIGFIGHSQGTAVMFALLSQTKKFNDIVKPFIAISPITRIGSAKTTFRYVIKALKPLLLLDNGPVFTKDKLLSSITAFACDFPTIPRLTCETIFFSVTGPDFEQLNRTRLGVYVSKMPSSTSKKNLNHFDQMFDTNEFKRYDYGSAENNQKIYGQDKPPIYDLRNISHSSVYVIYGSNDYFVPMDGIEQLKQDLSGAKEFYEIPNTKSNHMDPLIGLSDSIIVNQKIIEILKTY